MRKNYIKIPKNILNKVNSLDGNLITVFGFLKITKDDIIKGNYSHLDISINNDTIEFPDYVLPTPRQGRYSKYNSLGRIIKFKNLPKIEKIFSFDSPNFGDPSKGYHTTSITRPVYQTRLNPPKFISLILESQEYNQENIYVIKVYTNILIDKTSKNFKDDLLFHLNILQENIGNCDITDEYVENEKYIDEIYVNWELLPPGEKYVSQNVSIILSKINNPNANVTATLKDRLEFFNSLGSIKYIHGTNKFNSYIGALFPEDIVLLENYSYGNAAYIFPSNWEEFSKLSRTDLLSYHDDKIIRIIHNKNWKNNLKNALNSLI
ncbi:hypothetical protein [Clostridium cadaveris]|uniref:hypothetical protein n=1 Tax=Clostridium cadaveris TaxID=1529 RepID=UPI000C06B4F3|nr:hypothetical protein [Clostridium cadaveris]